MPTEIEGYILFVLGIMTMMVGISGFIIDRKRNMQDGSIIGFGLQILIALWFISGGIKIILMNIG